MALKSRLAPSALEEETRCDTCIQFLDCTYIFDYFSHTYCLKSNFT